MPPISVLMKPSSGMCNMSCDYCFYCDEAQKRVQESYGFMEETTLKNIIRKNNRKGIEVHNALQTNGFAINEEWCRLFMEHNFLVGISIDGIKEVHDAYRHDKKGGGTYEKVVKATELMDIFGVDYNILTVVNQKTEYAVSAEQYGMFLIRLSLLFVQRRMPAASGPGSGYRLLQEFFVPGL